MAAILLRKLLTRDADPSSSSYLWPRLSPQTQSSLKSALLSVIQREDSKSISKKVCDTISELASGLLDDDSWPEFLPFLFSAVAASDSPRLAESSLLIFSQLTQYIGHTLVPHLALLHSILLASLSHPTSADVRIAALNAAINLVQCLPSAQERDQFQDLLPAMIRTLTEALNTGQEATAQEALELLIELAGTEPRFLRKQLPDVVGSMLQIAEAPQLEEGTRHLAVEFVITLAEARERAPGMMRRLPQFVARLFSVLMKMLLDINDEPSWHGAETEDEDAGEMSSYSVGQESLDRLSIALGGNTIVPVASEQLPAYFSSPEWQKRHAALITLAQIAEGCCKVYEFDCLFNHNNLACCSGCFGLIACVIYLFIFMQVMIKNLEQVVNMVLTSFQDPHPRVRWAAINAIGQLSTDLGPDLQDQYHHRVLPALAGAMDDFQNSRVQASLQSYFTLLCILPYRSIYFIMFVFD